ncbi:MULTISPECIES: hypothetical protein [unclassified Pseudomonas]|uniref:hypothetical protein n=1 Tax=unclassified Pseudomonas TaxID=196821 RepID=UPI00211542E5|nr:MULTISPECIES: hypothetical protein [unclassified Pseudomonas]
MNTERLQHTHTYSPKWQERFEFFERLEPLDKKEKRNAAKSLGLKVAKDKFQLHRVLLRDNLFLRIGLVETQSVDGRHHCSGLLGDWIRLSHSRY